MIDKETYKKELMRMYAWVRKDDVYNMKDCNNFMGKKCDECPIRHYCFVLKPSRDNATRPYDAFEVIEAVERWSKEHQPKKYQVSRLEYDILKIYIEAECHGYFYEYGVIMEILKKGYFKGANGKMKIEYYFNNCEVIKNEQD